MVSSSRYYYFRCVWSGIPKLPKVISLLFARSLLEVSDGVDFFHADKHESFLQIDTLIFDADDQV